MRPIGNAPPRSKENDKIKAEIWAEQCNQRNKPPTPESIINDQLGASGHEHDEPGYFDCCKCGEAYMLTPGEPIPPFIFDYKSMTRWCEPCFREYAKELLNS